MNEGKDSKKSRKRILVRKYYDIAFFGLELVDCKNQEYAYESNLRLSALQMGVFPMIRTCNCQNNS